MQVDMSKPRSPKCPNCDTELDYEGDAVYDGETEVTRCLICGCLF